MRTSPFTRSVVVAALGLSSSACGAIGPSCLDARKTGDVIALSGVVEPAAVASHEVPYDRQGSQNNVAISWGEQGLRDAPRVQLYATSARCEGFVAPGSAGAADPNADACTIIARCGGTLAPDARPCAHSGTCAPSAEEIVCRSLTVTGPGNGAPPDFDRYKLHVVGDRDARASYSIQITWFYGPDC